MTTPNAAANRIVILDDDPDVLRILAVALGQGGNAIITATDGAAALELCKVERPHLVIVDLMMPGMDGETFLRRLALALGPDKPDVLILTASSMRSEVARKVGVPSIAKPFDLEELRELVDQLLAGRRRRKSTPP